MGGSLFKEHETSYLTLFWVALFSGLKVDISGTKSPKYLLINPVHICVHYCQSPMYKSSPLIVLSLLVSPRKVSPKVYGILVTGKQ